MFDLSKIRKIAFVVSIGLILAASAFAQTTQFTYQGRLTDSTLPSPTNGTYEMQFKAFDASAGGNQFTVVVTLPTVQVTNGIFTVQLDFGAAAFNGQNVFLEIGARPAGNPNPYTVLNPRQQFTSAPYAVQSLNAVNAQNANNSANLGGVPANQYVQTGDSRLTDARAPTSGSFSYIQNTNSVQPFSSFNVSGNGTVGAIFSASIINSDTQYNLGGSRFMLATDPISSSNLFVGLGAGPASVGGTIQNTFVGARVGASTSGSSNSFFGSFAGGNNTTGSGNTFIGAGTGGGNGSGGANVFVGDFTGGHNVSGNNNTIIGEQADVAIGSGNLTFATALGSQAIVGTSNTIMLGRDADTVIAPNLLQVNTLGSAGSTSLCRNASNQISTCTAGNKPAEGGTANAAEVVSLRSQVTIQSEQLKQQQLQIDGLRKLVCALSPQAEVCKEIK